MLTLYYSPNSCALASHIALERKSAAVFNWFVGEPGYGGHVAIRIDGQFGYLHDGLSLCGSAKQAGHRGPAAAKFSSLCGNVRLDVQDELTRQDEP